MKVFLLILAIVMPNGEVKIAKEIVASCPTDAEVVSVMRPKVEKKEILAWGGTCGPLPQATGI
jgi:hypothetical protein